MRFSFRRSFLLFLLPFFLGASLRAHISHDSKDRNYASGKKTFLLVPSTWTDAHIIELFGQNFERLDTNVADFHNEVKRLVVYSAYYNKLSSVALHCRNVKELVLCGPDPIDRAATQQFIHLESLELRIESFSSDGHYYYADAISIASMHHELPGVLRAIPKLERFTYYGPLDFIPQQIPGTLSEIHCEEGLKWLPVFTHGASVNEPGMLHYLLYPELVSLQYTGCAVGTTPVLSFYEATKDITAEVPFWYEGKRNAKQPRVQPAPDNGNYILRYDNGNTIVEGKMNNSQPDGEWNWYYADGKLCERRHYSNGVETGDWIFMDDMGDTTRFFAFSDGNLLHEADYRCDTLWEDSRQTIKGYYIMKTIHGLTDSSKVDIGNYYLRKSPYDSLYQSMVRTYCPGNQFVNGIALKTVNYEYEDGKLMKVSSIKQKGDTIIDTTLYPNDQLFAVELRLTRYREIKRTEWDSSGEIVLKGWITYSAMNYSDTLTGEYCHYVKGRMARKDNYDAYKYHKIILYNENGTEEEWLYCYGKPATLTEYGDTDKEKTVSEYKDGKLVKRTVYPKK